MDYNFRFAKLYVYYVYSMEDMNGNLVNEMDHIGDSFIEYYNNMLGTEKKVSRYIHCHIVELGPMVNGDQADSLCRQITEEEIKSALWDIPEAKSPGLDGFSFVGGDLVNAIQDFFINGGLLKQVNNTSITYTKKNLKSNKGNRGNDLRTTT